MEYFTRLSGKLAALLVSVFSWRKRQVSTPAKAAPAKEKQAPEVGISTSRDIHGLLDNLPKYFRDLKALKQSDPDAYDVFSSLGGPMGSRKDDTTFMKGKFLDEFLANPPAIRCYFMTPDDDPKSKNVPGSIIYMMKLAGGSTYIDNVGGMVIMPQGICYRLSMVWILKGKAVVQRCFIRVRDDGTMEIIKESRMVRKQLKHKGGHTSSFSAKEYGIPRWIKELKEDEGHPNPVKWIEDCAHLCASTRRPTDCIMVRASRDGMTAAWVIDRNDAKRFFRLRETGTAADGRRKRVLHYVAPFERMVGNRHQHVREHYRGERKFGWEGYTIDISGLGFHHEDFFASPISQYETDEPTKKMISLRRASRVITQYYSRPRFLTPRRKAKKIDFFMGDDAP